MRSLIPALLAATFFVSACGDEAAPPREAAPPPPATENTIPFRRDGTLTFLQNGSELVSIDIEIAETDSALQRGLMQRAALPERSGMLFRFEREELQSFWMANTPLALDILFVDADSQIVHVARYTRPFSQESIDSRAPAQYVVEVPAGFADRYGIVEGDHVAWRRDTGPVTSAP